MRARSGGTARGTARRAKTVTRGIPSVNEETVRHLDKLLQRCPVNRRGGYTGKTMPLCNRCAGSGACPACLLARSAGSRGGSGGRQSPRNEGGGRGVKAPSKAEPKTLAIKAGRTDFMERVCHTLYIEVWEVMGSHSIRRAEANGTPARKVGRLALRNASACRCRRPGSRAE